MARAGRPSLLCPVNASVDRGTEAEGRSVRGKRIASAFSGRTRSKTSSRRLSAESRLFGDGWAAEDPVGRVPPHQQIVSPRGRHWEDAGSARGKGAIDVPMGGGEGCLAGGRRGATADPSDHCRVRLGGGIGCLWVVCFQKWLKKIFNSSYVEKFEKPTERRCCMVLCVNGRPSWVLGWLRRR